MTEVTNEPRMNDLKYKWKLILVFRLAFFAISHQSIAGVTYMDNFDFEERYRNVDECDPFYWHPLHLPEHCAEMYENLIRSRLGKHRPVRVLKEYDSFEYPTHRSNKIAKHRYQHINFEDMEDYEYERRPLSQYEQMLDLLRKDVARNPSAPSIGIMPNIGPVAVYHQPISMKSKNMIKKISRLYAKAQRRSHGGTYYGQIELPSDTDTAKETANNDQTSENDNTNTAKIIEISR